MFSKNSSKKNMQTEPAMVSNLASGLIIEGDVSAQGVMRIDGEIKGNVKCNGKVVLGASGKIVGDLKAEEADILGFVQGNIHTEGLLTLKSGCGINGNLFVGKLDIQPDAAFNGTCNMNSKEQALITEKASNI